MSRGHFYAATAFHAVVVQMLLYLVCCQIDMGILVRVTWLDLCMLVLARVSNRTLALIFLQLLVVEGYLFLVKLTASAKYKEARDLMAFQVSMVSRNSIAVVVKLESVEYNSNWTVKEDVMRLSGWVD